MDIQPGQMYKHYKGGLYKIVDCGIHTETKEEMVVYKSLNTSDNSSSATLWIRPRNMFEESVDLNGRAVGRFTAID